jgi:hypothetical protein
MGIFILVQNEVEIFVLVVYDAASHARKRRPQSGVRYTHTENYEKTQDKINPSEITRHYLHQNPEIIFLLILLVSLCLYYKRNDLRFSNAKDDEETGHKISKSLVFVSVFVVKFFKINS